MADRQGLLQGFNLSVVQTRANYLLELVERQREVNRYDRTFRERLFATGRYDAETLFPEWIDEAEATDVEQATDEWGEAVSTRYVMQEDSSSFDADQADDWIAAMLTETSSGSVSGEWA